MPKDKKTSLKTALPSPADGHQQLQLQTQGVKAEDAKKLVQQRKKPPVAKVWDYIRKNNLQKPTDKRTIVADANLK